MSDPNSLKWVTTNLPQRVYYTRWLSDKVKIKLSADAVRYYPEPCDAEPMVSVSYKYNNRTHKADNINTPTHTVEYTVRIYEKSRTGDPICQISRTRSAERLPLAIDRTLQVLTNTILTVINDIAQNKGINIDDLEAQITSCQHTKNEGRVSMHVINNRRVIKDQPWVDNTGKTAEGYEPTCYWYTILCNSQNEHTYREIEWRLPANNEEDAQKIINRYNVRFKNNELPYKFFIDKENSGIPSCTYAFNATEYEWQFVNSANKWQLERLAIYQIASNQVPLYRYIVKRSDREEPLAGNLIARNIYEARELLTAINNQLDFLKTKDQMTGKQIVCELTGEREPTTYSGMSIVLDQMGIIKKWHQYNAMAYLTRYQPNDPESRAYYLYKKIKAGEYDNDADRLFDLLAIAQEKMINSLILANDRSKAYRSKKTSQNLSDNRAENNAPTTEAGEIKNPA